MPRTSSSDRILRTILALQASRSPAGTCKSFSCRAISVRQRQSRQYHRNMSLIVCARSEAHTSELQSLMHISYAVFCLQKNNTHYNHNDNNTTTPTTNT